MAKDWELTGGLEYEIAGNSYSNASVITTSAGAGAGNNGFSPAYLFSAPKAGGDALRAEELLDFSNVHESFLSAGDTQQLFPMSAADAPSSAAGRPFSGDSGSLDYHYEFSIPAEEAAELEWLSKFVEDSYSDMPPPAGCMIFPSINAGHVGGAGDNSPASAAPGRGARSKRSRAAAVTAATAWHSLISPTQSSPSSSSSSSDFPAASKPNSNSSSRGKKSVGGSGDVGVEGGVRRCTHCASEKTPQWRTGPLGPKTLCNACGVRFKSGRLMPEYRPAASPTFVLTQHSNSHRKVMELRRQKEMLVIRGSTTGLPSSTAPSTGGGGQRPELLFHEYGVC